MDFIQRNLSSCIKAISILFSLTILFTISCKLIFAQISSSGIGIETPIADEGVESGDLVCSYSDGVKRCSTEYDPGAIGVVSFAPAVSLEDEDDNTFLVIGQGVAEVRVTSLNGNIADGDLISTSTRLGLGQKATRNGYVVGNALENYDSDNTEAIGVIQVQINPHPASGLTSSRGNLLQFIRQGLAVPVFEPLESLRYILAIIIVLISFTLGMIYFGRASRTGIEAIGRNPLAKRTIQFTVLMNIVLTIVIVLVGLAIAYLILIL